MFQSHGRWGYVKENNPSKHKPNLFLPHGIIRLTLHLHCSEVMEDPAPELWPLPLQVDEQHHKGKA